MIPALRWAAMRDILMFQQDVMEKVTRQCPQTTFLKRKESRSGIELRSFRLPAYRLTARPNRLSRAHTHWGPKFITSPEERIFLESTQTLTGEKSMGRYKVVCNGHLFPSIGATGIVCVTSAQQLGQQLRGTLVARCTSCSAMAKCMCVQL